MCREEVVWITKLDCRGDAQLYSKVESICRDIKEKDETFIYMTDGFYIYIYSKDRDTAHKRGMWFHRKINGKILYRVYYRRLEA